MTLFGAFLVDAEQFPLSRTLQDSPEIVIEVERVVATDELVTPYFWMTGGSVDAFEEAAADDPTMDELRRLDTFDDGTLYRADWTEHGDVLAFAYTQVGTTILEATGQDRQWELRMQFDGRDHLEQFRTHLHTNELVFTLTELHEINHARSPGQYGLTEKQEEALVTAWDMDYFETPREVTLSAIAEELGISEQALSNRLRRGYETLIANTLRVTPPTES